MFKSIGDFFYRLDNLLTDRESRLYAAAKTTVNNVNTARLETKDELGTITGCIRDAAISPRDIDLKQSPSPYSQGEVEGQNT